MSRIPCPPGARIAVVADTHSRPHPALHGQLRAEAPSAILHAGDIGDLAVLDGLATIAPLYAVRGNIDERGQTGTEAPPPERILTLAEPGDAGETGLVARLLLLHIGVRGPRLNAYARRRAEAVRADIVVCGHSHVPLVARDGDVVVFNPGSCGPRRFALPIVFGLICRDAAGLSLRHVNCETGERWMPA